MSAFFLIQYHRTMTHMMPDPASHQVIARPMFGCAFWVKAEPKQD